MDSAEVRNIADSGNIVHSRGINNTTSINGKIGYEGVEVMLVFSFPFLYFPFLFISFHFPFFHTWKYCPLSQITNERSHGKLSS